MRPDDSRAREGRDWDSLILMFQPRGDPYFPHQSLSRVFKKFFSLNIFILLIWLHQVLAVAWEDFSVACRI